MKRLVLIMVLCFTMLSVILAGCMTTRPQNSSSSSTTQSVSTSSSSSEESFSSEQSSSSTESSSIDSSSSSSSSSSEESSSSSSEESSSSSSSESSSTESSSGSSSSSSSSSSQVKEYTIVFADEDGTELKSIIVAEGQAVEYEGEEPSKATTAEFTYTFAGWTDGTNNYAKDEELPLASKGVTYIAQFTSTVNQYVVTITQPTGGTITVKNGTTTISSGTKVDYGTTLTLSNTASTGYTFKNYTVNSKTQETTSVTISGATTITGAFTINSYTIKFNANSGDGTMSDLSMTYGTAKTLTANAFTKTGYTFLGWSTSSTATSATYTDKQSVNNLTATNGATVTLYAVWTESTNTKYTVKHYQMDLDGENYTLFETENLTGTTNASVTPSVKSYEGFTVPSTQTVTIVADGSSVVEYKYTRNQYYLDINNYLDYDEETATGTSISDVSKSNIGSFDVYVNGELVKEGVGDCYVQVYYASVYEIKNIKSLDGYSYVGYIKAQGIATGTITGTTPSRNSSHRLIWKTNSYTITFNSNGGSSVTAITQNYNTTVTAPTAPTKTGYTFGGWYSDSGLTKAYTFSKMPAENITLYAKWDKNTYTITWKNDNGSILKTESLAYGATPSYSGTPTCADTTEEYAFYAWTPTIEAVTGNATYTANYIEKDIEYDDFDVVGNGSTDDFEALYKAHAYANGTGATKVVAQSKTYYVCNTIPSAKLLEWANSIISGTHTTAHNSKCKYGANVAHINENGLATDCHGNLVTEELIAWINTNLSKIKATTALTIPITTNVDWGNAKIIIDDTNVASLVVSGTTTAVPTDKVYETDIFSVLSTNYSFSKSISTTKYNATIAETMTTEEFNTLIKSNTYIKKINDIIQTSGIGTNTTKIDLGLGYPAAIVIFNEDLATSAERYIAGETVQVGHQKVYIRYGSNATSGSKKRDIIILDKDGNIDPSTPINFDYTRITTINIRDLRVPQITLTGGEFTTMASQIDGKFSVNSDGTINNSGTKEGGYIRRGISISRSNTIIDGLKHYVINELDLADYDNDLNAAAYGSFCQINQCADITFKNCIFTSRRYSDIAGCYELFVYVAANIKFIDCTQSNFWVIENDDGSITSVDRDTPNAVISTTNSTKNNKKIQMFWSISTTYWSKNVEYHNSTFTTYTTHEGCTNGKIIDSIVAQINVVGFGDFLIENSEVICKDKNANTNNVIYLKFDYGATWKGDITIKDVTVTLHEDATDFRIAYFEYINHDFGLECYLPNLTIENLTLSKVVPSYIFGSGRTGLDYSNSFANSVLDTGETNLNVFNVPEYIIIDDYSKYSYELNYVADGYLAKDTFSSVNVPVTLTINHLKADGTLLATETVSVGYNEEYTVNAKTFSGYVAHTNTVKGCYAEDKIATLTVYYSSTSATWDGNFPTLTNGYVFMGEGTESSPYLIQSAEDLAALSALTQYNEDTKSTKWTGHCKGECYLLTENLDMSAGEWKSIASGYNVTWHVFKGVFDGGNHTITLNQTSGSALGLFQGLQGAVVKNLTLEGTMSSGNRLSGLAYVIYGESSTETSIIQNVTNKIEITATNTSGNAYSGGLIGTINGGALYFENCSNEGNITSLGAIKVGGILGNIFVDSAVVTIKGVTNTGTIKCVDTVANTDIGSASSYLGNIVGYADKGTLTSI